MSDLTMPEVVLRGIFLVLGVGIGVTMLVLRFRSKDDDFEWGCLPIVMGFIAVTLVVGGVAGPEAAAAWWQR